MNDYTTVTELPGRGATKEQLSMALTRYNLAQKIGEDKDILEIACGPGLGLGYMAKKAKSVIGGDIDPVQVQMGNDYYEGRIKLVELNAEKLPFNNQSFDVILLLEAIYYIEDTDTFFKEAVRLLRPNGKLMICYPNNEWENFNPSPFTFNYFTHKEMADLMKTHNFEVETKAGYKHEISGFKSQIINLIRKVAVKLHLIPKTFVIKEILKKVFLGRLLPIPNEISDSNGSIYPLETIDSQNPNLKHYRVIYSIGTLKS